jgi:hypothetical protein
MHTPLFFYVVAIFLLFARGQGEPPVHFYVSPVTVANSKQTIFTVFATSKQEK